MNYTIFKGRYVIQRAMEKISQKSAILSIIIILLFIAYASLRLNQSDLIREPRSSFGDTDGYLAIAFRPLFSSAFWFSERPPGVPLFFKLLQNNPERIFAVQLWLSIFAWGFLALAVQKCIQIYWLRLPVFVMVLAFSLSEHVILWDPLILSDSTSVSLWAVFTGVSLLLIQEWNPFRFFILVVAAILLLSVRDTYSFFLLMGGCVLLILSIYPARIMRMRMIWLGSSFLILALVANTLVSATNRWVPSFLNVVGWRILPNSEYLAYFEAHGMPVSDALLELKGELSYGKDLAFYRDPRLEEFRLWVKEHGIREFAKFLWFYKADTLQLPLHEPKEIVNPDVYFYAATGYRPIIKDQRLSEILYPIRFGELAFFLANLFAASLIFPAFYYRQPLWIVPLLLILFSYPQAVLMWNTDPHDIARHSLYHSIQWRFGVWLMISFVMDLFFSLLSDRIRVSQSVNHYPE